MDGSAIGEGLGTAILTFAAIAFVAGVLIVGAIWFFTLDTEIRVTEPLKPIRTELFINDNNEVDTLYIYKK